MTTTKWILLAVGVLALLVAAAVTLRRRRRAGGVVAVKVAPAKSNSEREP